MRPGVYVQKRPESVHVFVVGNDGQRAEIRAVSYPYSRALVIEVQHDAPAPASVGVESYAEPFDDYNGEHAAEWEKVK